MNAYVRAHVSEGRNKKKTQQYTQTAAEAVAIKALHGRTGSLSLIVLHMMHAAYDHIIIFIRLFSLSYTFHPTLARTMTTTHRRKHK